MVTVSSWQAADALRSACEYGHNWIVHRANKFKTIKSGYNKIRPRILGGGLSTFDKEFYEYEDTFDGFRVGRSSRIHSIGVLDDKVREKFEEQHGLKNEKCTQDIDENEVFKRNKEAMQQRRKSVDVMIATTQKKRRNSRQNSKIVLRSSDDVVKILPSVLLTYDEKFTKIGINENSTKINQTLKFSDKQDYQFESSDA